MLPRTIFGRAAQLVAQRGVSAGRSAGMSSLRHFSTRPDTVMSNPSKEDVQKIEVRIAPIVRTGETADVKRARLLYQSRKRGILETDLLLSKFAKLYLAEMSMEEMDEYDKLLDEQDWDIYYWATEAEGQPPAPERWSNSAILQKLRIMSKNSEREVMRMANLY